MAWSEQKPLEKKHAACRGSGLDSMPDLVVDAILVRLPIRDAIRTSLLARDWRYRWETIPDLVFDGRTFPVLFTTPRVRKTVRDGSIVSFVNRVLLLHRAETIRKFELSSVPNFNGLQLILGNWATKLARSGVQTLILSFEQDKKSAPYDIHKDFFSCRGLVSLELPRCVVKPPEGFGGFPCLTNLTLRNANINDTDLSHLVSACQQLERLCLQDCFDSTHAKFDMRAPNLQHLELLGIYSLEHASLYAPVLSSAIITFSLCTTSDVVLGANLARLLSSSANVHKLEIVYRRLKFVYVVHAPPTLIFVKSLRVHWNFECLRQTQCFMQLIESFPTLNHLQVDNNTHLWAISPLANYWEENVHVFELSNLRSLKFKMVDASKAEMNFVSFVLENAPFLEHVKLTMQSSIHSKNKRAFESLFATKVASTRVRIDLSSHGCRSAFVSKLLNASYKIRN